MLNDNNYKTSIWNNKKHFNCLCNYIERSRLLLLTSKASNIKTIMDDFPLSEQQIQWCKNTLRLLMYKCTEYHLPYLFGIFVHRFQY